MAISYGDEKYTQSLKINSITAKLFGRADIVKVYTPSDIDLNFRKVNSEILKKPRGGYWLWKPYVILKALEKLSYDDYLMYLDAGAFYIRSLRYFQKQLEIDKVDIMLSSSIFPEKHWSKRDIFVYLNCDDDYFKDSHQIEATFMFIKKTEHSVAFINEWLSYCRRIELISDNQNICGLNNDVGFREHRHDQSILSVLSKKWDIEPYKGFAGSSDLGKYIFIKDRRYYGYRKDEIVHFAADEMNSNIYYKSKFPRIIVSTRLKNQKLHYYIIHLVGSIYRAIRTDTLGKLVARRMLRCNFGKGT